MYEFWTSYPHDNVNEYDFNYAMVYYTKYK